MNIERNFHIAKLLSVKSTHHKYRLGCVIVKGKEIVGLGFNQYKTHPKSAHPWKFVHAEFSAILGVKPADLINSVAFVYRETLCGNVGMAKPCPYCYGMLRACGVKQVYYTTERGYEIINLI